MPIDGIIIIILCLATDCRCFLDFCFCLKKFQKLLFILRFVHFFRYNDSQIYKFENVFQKTFTNTTSHFYFQTMKFCSIFWCAFGSGISNFLKFLLSFSVFLFFPLNWTFFFPFLFFLRHPLCTSLNVLETSTIGVLCFGSCRVFDAPFNASIFHSSSRLSSFPPSSFPNLTKFCSVWF